MNRRHFSGPVSKAILLLTAVIGAALIVHVWSLRHGPDTEQANACFQSVLHFPPPDSVKGVYCKRENWYFLYSAAKLRFEFEDTNVLDRIQESVYVERSMRTHTYGSIRSEFPSRWLKGAPEPAEAVTEHYSFFAGDSNETTSRMLWIDYDRNIAYYSYEREIDMDY